MCFTPCNRSHDPVSVEPYLGRCFPGIKRLVVTKEWGVHIHALISPEGEHLQLRAPVDLVVRWLSCLFNVCVFVNTCGPCGVLAVVPF